MLFLTLRSSHSWSVIILRSFVGGFLFYFWHLSSHYKKPLCTYWNIIYLRKKMPLWNNIQVA